MTEKPAGHEHSKRDSEILQVLGLFLIVLSLPVYVGAYFAKEPFPTVINLIAAAIITLIGAAMIFRGRRIARTLPR